MDYDDLLLRCADLLRRHPECVSNVEAVLVDEFQDTNSVQYELMNLLASKNRRITVVGDPDQSIYGFRSAEIKNLARMQKKYSDTSVVLLEDNYRSSGSILSSAQDVIEQDTSRPAKKLQPTHGVGTMPVMRKLPSAQAEAQWIVLEIKRSIAMTGKLLDYSDFAVLLRSAALSRQIESEMGKKGVPYKMVGGLRFFDRVEIKLLLDYMRVVSHPGNTDALLRIINTPSRKIGEETIKMLLRNAEEAKVPLWNFVKDVAQGRRSAGKDLAKNTDQGLCVFVGLIESARQTLLDCKDSSAPRRLLEFIIKKLSFREFLNKTDPQKEETRWDNVKELLVQAGDPAQTEETEPDDNLPEIQGLEQEQAHPGEEALSRFLANVALSTEVTSQENKDGEQPQSKVTISTIHAAKGLEWPVVFVPAVYNGIIPHSRAEDADEERRLLYVAMTRAQALLYLSYPLFDARTDGETKSTQFITPKIIKERLRPVGPVFNEQVVYVIADILRRSRPSAEDIAKEEVTLASTRDDLWTADGKKVENPDTMDDSASTSAAMDDAPHPKKRRYDQDQPSTSSFTFSSTYTMNNSSNFSVPTTMGGFSSAREYITTSAATEPEQTRRTESDSKPKATSSVAAGTGRKAGGLSQGTISGFLGIAPPKGRDSTSTPSTQTSRQSNRNTNTVGQPSRPQIANPASKNVIPSKFLGHRPPAQPALQTSRPTLEPSDPNKYTWLATPSKPAEKPIMRRPPKDEGRSKMEGESQAEWGAGEVKNDSGSVGGVRPVATYHATTMSTLHQPGVRKTLGVRRTQYTWEDRMKRERQ
ncbi:hypothetical protein AWENTII_009772 [Aspergillus wentii]